MAQPHWRWCPHALLPDDPELQGKKMVFISRWCFVCTCKFSSDSPLPVTVYPSFSLFTQLSWKTNLQKSSVTFKNWEEISAEFKLSRQDIFSGAVGKEKVKHFLEGNNFWMHSLGKLYSNTLLEVPRKDEHILYLLSVPEKSMHVLWVQLVELPDTKCWDLNTKTIQHNNKY